MSDFKLGTVASLATNNSARVKFDGEEEVSTKEYAYLAGYYPTVGDRVLLADVAGTNIIVGKLSAGVNPVNGGGKLIVNGLLYHTGNLGFFGKLGVTKSTVSDPAALTTVSFTAPTTYSATTFTTQHGRILTDLTMLRSKLLELLDALQSYGLI